MVVVVAPAEVFDLDVGRQLEPQMIFGYLDSKSQVMLLQDSQNYLIAVCVVDDQNSQPLKHLFYLKFKI